ncbi:uncharacterized protein LOC120251287 [Dioscorea cayenensis subsp. rotundata]|uniref:Uncharacterized protein LOC120251287 n=1 Tax=Dioscorea cayennensis subsp. rotundata TaxID=55577 RepID=A0AB40ALF2_DIOCR|nr:uncharacterized protein LOC120251287 [Dioscorea cayenensis subsp. rotundata]
MGYNNWKNAISTFRDHEVNVTSIHNFAADKLELFKNPRQHVTLKISQHSSEMEVAYRVRLTAVLDIMQFLLRQGLAFRGHDESSSSKNKVRSLMIEDIGDRIFSLMVDEARYILVKEQMAIVLRYVDSRGQMIERFLCVEHVTDASSYTLKEVIDNLFAKYGLSLSRLRGQGYDGASNMRGEFNDLKSLILKDNPYASYVIKIVNLVGASRKRKDALRQSQHENIVTHIEKGVISTGRG